MKVTGIRLSANDSVYTNRDGSKAVSTCTAQVEIADGVTVDATVYARFKDGDGAVRFEATVPSKGISFSDTVKQAVIDAAETNIAVWGGWQPAADRAERLLTQPKSAGKAGSKLTPRLVGKPAENTAPAAKVTLSSQPAAK